MYVGETRGSDWGLEKAEWVRNLYILKRKVTD